MLYFTVTWIFLGLLGLLDFNRLPIPRNMGSLDIDQRLFNEERALQVVKVLAKDIGMRLVGTPQESQSIHYIMDTLNDLKKVAKVDFKLEKQNADGSHLFEMMGVPVIKTYSNITNIIVTLTCKGKDCSKDAVLLNSHFDSTIVTPGAADDAASVGIMIELIRIFSQATNLRKSVIFLFNGAEETLQDATHAFLTQHPLASRVKAVINMEAMGAKGQEILFQANSPFLIKAYSHAPHPHASSLSNDVFRTGLLLSDTDYRQFMQYGNELLGLDFAFYKNSYHYHTNLDTVENIEPGSIQHFGDNIQAVLNYLLTTSDPWDMQRDSTMVYFVYPGGFFIFYSAFFSKVFHSVLALFSVYTSRVYAKEMIGMSIRDVLAETISMGACLVIGIISAVSVGILMSLYDPMSWFSSEFYAILCFSLPFLLGLLIMPTYSQAPGKIDPERSSLVGFTNFFAALLLMTTFNGIASSYLLVFHTATLTLALLIDFATAPKPKSVKGKKGTRAFVSWIAYLVLMGPMVPFGVVTGLSIIYVFVPITGRIGLEAPVDILIPLIVSVAMIMSQAYILIPVSFRMSTKERKRVAKALAFVVFVIATGFAAFVHPYSADTPKRLYVSFMENTTSSERGLHIAYADIGSQKDPISALEKEFKTSAVKRTVPQTDKDWATLFPFSRFIANYYINLTEVYPVPFVIKKPYISSTSTVHANGTKTINLKCHHQDFIWSVLVFEAVVLDWSLEIDAPSYTKHTIRHVGGDGNSEWTLSLLVNSTDSLRVDVTGVERDGFHALIPNSHRNGFKWLWSDHFTSAVALRRVDYALPEWTTALLVGIVQSSHVVE